ncbi:unnamed protein product [Ectocarpus fasciculatus]
MQENAFLSDFFGCVGFLPLTTKSDIRETMIKIMTSPSSLQQSAVGGDYGDERSLDEIAPGVDWSKASERVQLPMDPSSCTFWCALALGALAKGSPIESTPLPHTAFVKRCRSTLNWHRKLWLRGTPAPQTWRSQGLGQFIVWLKSTCTALMCPFAHQGFAEIVKHNYAALSSSGHQWQMKSYRPKERATPPQLNGAATEVELYRYVAQSYRAFEVIVHQTASNQIATPCDNLCEAESDRGSDAALQLDLVLLPREVSDAIGTVLEGVSGLSLEPLQEAADRRPSVRGGFGSLLINAGLVFTKAALGDLHAALERIGRCVEVYERYPGVCRSTVGCHVAHVVLVSLAAIGDCRAQAMYDRLRGSYNSFRPAGSRPVPCLNEWRGVDDFCDDVYCRAQDLASSKLKAFSASPVESMIACVGTKGMVVEEGETALQGHWENQSSTLSACNVAEKAIGTVPIFSTGGEAECRMGSTIVSSAPIASPSSSQNPCRLLTTGRHSDKVESKVDSVHIAPEWLSRLPGMSDGVVMAEVTEEDSIGAGDWLDVTHGMLDTL